MWGEGMHQWREAGGGENTEQELLWPPSGLWSSPLPLLAEHLPTPHPSSRHSPFLC